MVSKKEEALSDRYQQARRPIKGIRSFHCFVPTSSGLVAYSLSCDKLGNGGIEFPWIVDNTLPKEPRSQDTDHKNTKSQDDVIERLD